MTQLVNPNATHTSATRRNMSYLLKDIVKVEGRSVVFSTHYLEEADLLADRKVILAHGKVTAIRGC